jgi:NhaA family Na+:H+ antiporter
VSLKVFLLALAIVDDLGAIAVIAIFYTDDLAYDWLALALLVFLLTALLGQFGVRSLIVYAALAVVAWLAIHESGIHATIAGVVLGLLTPVEPHYDDQRLRESANDLVIQFARGRADGSSEGIETADSALRELEELARESQSPLDRLEHALHPWTSYAIIPLFALANAGIELTNGSLSDALSSPVSWGIMLGLLVGKPVGIFTASYVAVRLGLATLPANTTWGQVSSVGMVAGVGFTVSLFITNLAFDDVALIDEAKIAILAGSALVGIAGMVTLSAVLRRSPTSAAAVA